MDPKLFESPPTAYRGVTLWMLNDKLETDEIVRQLEGFHDAGWGAVIDRTFNGLLTEYLSDEWMEMVEAIVNRAGELGLRVWLQAGYMPSAVPDLPAELQYKGLARRPLGEPGEAGEVVLAEDPEFAYCRAGPRHRPGPAERRRRDRLSQQGVQGRVVRPVRREVRQNDRGDLGG